jgi:hypothetical protein
MALSKPLTESKKMSRESSNTAINGYDYDNQAWYQNGVYVRCGHPESMGCNCYGKINAGIEVSPFIGVN